MGDPPLEMIGHDVVMDGHVRGTYATLCVLAVDVRSVSKVFHYHGIGTPDNPTVQKSVSPIALDGGPVVGKRCKVWFLVLAHPIVVDRHVEFITTVKTVGVKGHEGIPQYLN